MSQNVPVININDGVLNTAHIFRPGVSLSDAV